MIATNSVVQYDTAGNPVSGEAGATAPTAAVQVAGNDGTNLRVLLTDNTGRLLTTFSSTDTTATGNLNALNATVAVTLAGQAGAGFDLAAGTLVGTIVPEISYDNTSWETTFFEDPTTGNKVASIVFGASNTHTARSIYCPTGAGFARVRVSAFTSGTAAITVRASEVDGPVFLCTGASGGAAPPTITQVGGVNAGNLIALATDSSGNQRVVGPGAIGAAPTTNPVYVAGFDGTNLQALRTDTTGRQVVVGAAASGAAASGNPVLVAGEDGSGNVRPLLTDTTGRLVQIDEKAGTATLTSVGASVSSVTLLAANANRLGAVIINDTIVNKNILYLAFAATSTTSAYTYPLPPGAQWELQFDYTGAISGIWGVSATGNARVTELSP